VVIRRLGSYAGTRVFFGYDRYLLPEIAGYREILSAHGEVVEPIDASHLHYLTSAELVCKSIQDDVVDGQDVFGILICGTGMGMSIAANKFRGIYAARCTTVEDAELARTINNANVLCLAAKAGRELNREIVNAFVSTEYAGRKLDELEYITQFEAAPLPAPLRAVRRTA
jgi:ribose 5-phosphate isomerase B